MTRGPVNLLVVDDDQVDVMAVERAFQKRQVPVNITVASDGQEALDFLRGSQRPPLRWPYLVLLDLNMPRMNGLEFLRQLNKAPDNRSPPVFVRTTSADERDIAAATMRNVAGYLLKGSGTDCLLKLVDLLAAYWRTVELPP